jgi:predicted amidohydrolase YtcJ
MRLWLSLLTSSLALASATLHAATPTVLVNARIHTLDPERPVATWMRWDDTGQINAVGGDDDRPEVGVGGAIDAEGRTVIPGLIDAHGHLMGLGYSLTRANLVGTTSKADVIERLQIAARALPEGAWLLGRGWDQNDWPEKEFPTAADLDAAFPTRPVWLERIDGHASWGNSAALAAADRRFDGDWQPDGGRIERRDGKATGVFVDEASKLVEAAIPPPSAELQAAAFERALAEAVKHGLTGVHDAGVTLAELAMYRRFADAGKLPLRVTAMADGDKEALAALCAMGPYRHPGGRLQMRTVKLYVDGALGSRGAVLHADYDDAPGNRGLFVTAPAVFDAIVDKAAGCGLQIASHAIGDAGNTLVLDSYEKHLRAGDGNRRWRIEHAQLLRLDDVPRFSRLGVIASMQPTHATSDMPWAEARVGAARLRGAYAWRRLLDAGARLALGSDFPVESVDPLLGLYAAITRQDAAGKPPGGWLPEQRLRPDEALRGFTLDAAYAGFAEHEVGSLVPGKRADFVLLSDDVLEGEALRLLKTRVLATYVDGVAVYEARQ